MKCRVPLALFVVLIFVGSWSFAEERDSSEKQFSADCTAVQAGASCRSFNELIKANDKDLLAHMRYHPFVCFRQEEDEFTIITTERPPSESFRLDRDGISKAMSTEFLLSFKDGIKDDIRYVTGEWTKIPIQKDLDFTFLSRPTSPAQLSIDDSQISASYEFPNLGNTTTSYQIKIRRSTKRFVETYQFPTRPTPRRAKTLPEKPINSRLDYSGYCAEFN